MQLNKALIPVLVLVLAGTSFGQIPQPMSQQRAVRIEMQDEETKRLAAHLDEINSSLSRALLELEHCKNVGKINDEKIKALQDQVAAAENLLQIYKQMAEDYKAASQARASANALDDKIKANYDTVIKSYQDSIEQYKTEVANLRAERDKLRSQRKYIAGVALLLGAILGYLGANQ